jgi:shikimate kinase
MRLSLIGMSGSGKSHWSIRLAELGFKRFCCDEMIARNLSAELARADGTAMDLGEWMGFPYQPRYKEREATYLACEIEVLDEILAYLAGSARDPAEKVVVDTTGSVIYTGKQVMEKMCSLTTVVHFSTPPEVQERMLAVYTARPRPILWRDLFSKKPDEAHETALARCYPALLSSRERLYEKYADVTIDYYSRNQDSFGVDDLLREIEAAKVKP